MINMDQQDIKPCIQYKQILVPVDGSENSCRAIAAAVDMAELSQATISILYILTFSQQTPLQKQIHGDKVPHEVRSNPVEFAKSMLKDAGTLIPKHIRRRTYYEIGEPGIAITDFARRNHYDVIVIGSRGLNFLSGIWQGSVSKYVTANAQCSVLIIK
jgi:nucleotide-binding universal stress UspA family protein